MKLKLNLNLKKAAGLRIYLMLFALVASVNLHAALTIEITSGADNPVPVAVAPFAWHYSGIPKEDIASIVSSDLQRSGLFSAMDSEDMLSRPEFGEEIRFREWRLLDVQYLVVGSIKIVNDLYQINYELYDVNSSKKLGNWVIEEGKNLRDIGHHVSDVVYQKLTGVKGVFSTKLMYITLEKRSGGKRKYQLHVSDADGAREKTVLESSQPIMSPTWSPSGRLIAYVSYQGGRPAIYIQNRKSGERIKLTNFAGINGAPDWSPDGKYMAMTLSKDGNPEIYVMQLATKKLKRLTNHYAIDTEPRWSPDGKSLIFTSNRGGSPQIYRVSYQTNKVSRLSFEGNYNARAEISPDGQDLVMVHREGESFHISVQNLKNDTFTNLTKTNLDESPSIAPNGSMIIYATQHRGRGVLGAVSINGVVEYRLPSKIGEVREPVWSPFFN